MEKAIITVLLIVAGVVCVAVMFNGIFPAINSGSDAVVSMASKVDDRIQSQVDIIHATSEYNPDDTVNHWNDINGNGTFDILAWVKNVGSTRILGVDESDVFFGEDGDFQRVPYVDYANGVKPYWEYTLEDGATQWGPGDTLALTIVYADDFNSSGLTAGTTYLLKMIIPNGISDEIYFSL